MLLKIGGYIVGINVLFIGLCYMFDQQQVVPGILSGTFLAFLSLWLIFISVGKFLTSGAASKGFFTTLFLFKYLVMGLVIYYLIAWKHVSGIGILLGLSSVFGTFIAVTYLEKYNALRD